MRVPWRPFLAAFLGAGAIMVAYAMETQRGSAIEVRYGWMAIVPQVLAGVTIAGLALTTRRPQGLGLDLANLAMTALCTHLFLAFQYPLAPGEPRAAPWWAALDIVGWALPAVLLLFLLQMPMLPDRARAVLGAIVLVSFVMLARVAWEIFHEPTVMRGTGAVLGVLACVAAIRVASPRVPAR